MVAFLKYTDEQRRQALLLTAQKKGLPEPIIEKDWWVSQILNIVFDLEIADQLVFKGGTSLSKGWNLIERFSEDIDLAVNPEYFGVTALPTKKQIKSLRKRSSLFVAQELAEALQRALDEAGLSGECRLEVQPDGEGDGTYPEPRVISLYYRSLYEESSISYVQPVVKLEVGARSLIEPTEEIVCRSMVSEVLPVEDYKNVAISVAAPQKTLTKPEKGGLDN